MESKLNWQNLEGCVQRAQDTAEKYEYSSTPGRASLVAHMVKKLSATGETWVHP